MADAIDVPLIVWGTANHDKDTEVLRAVAEICQDKSLILGPVEEADHKKIGAAAIGYKHVVVASTPIDINLAKQLNILLGNLGVPDNLLVMDPTVSSIGYGIEYCYSVMERMRMAALTQQDDQAPVPHYLQPGQRGLEDQRSQDIRERRPQDGGCQKEGHPAGGHVRHDPASGRG